MVTSEDRTMGYLRSKSAIISLSNGDMSYDCEVLKSQKGSCTGHTQVLMAVGNRVLYDQISGSGSWTHSVCSQLYLSKLMEQQWSTPWKIARVS